MPEGHVLHRLARRLNRDFAHRELSVTSPQGRFATDAHALDGHPITRAEALGKHLFIHFDDAAGPAHIVYIHLGLIGSLRFEPTEDIWGKIRLRLETEELAANLRGPQACRRITDEELAVIAHKAGEDPLRDDADPELLWPKVNATNRTIAALLMDQSLFAGVGNIYRAETLFRLEINPFTKGKDLTHEQFDALWEDLVHLMRVGVATGRIDTVREEHTPQAMNRPPRKDDHGGEVYVYRRQGDPCYVCGHPIAHHNLQGRNLFFCPQCQQV